MPGGSASSTPTPASDSSFAVALTVSTVSGVGDTIPLSV